MLDLYWIAVLLNTWNRVRKACLKTERISMFSYDKFDILKE